MAHSDLSELTLLADMVEKLSRSEKGLQASAAASIAERIRACRDRLAGTATTASAHGTSTAARIPLCDASAPSLDASMKSHSGPTTKFVASGVAAQKTIITTPVSAASAPKDGGGCGPSDSFKALPTQRPSPPARLQQHLFQVKKPSSVRVAQVARETPPPTSAGVNREIAKSISSVIYNILETTVNLTQASSASVFLRKGDEMVSIVNVGAKISFPPKLVRHNCQGSLTAGVVASGIAINHRTEHPGRARSSVLVFPLRKGFSGSVDQTAFGVVQVQNKHGGASSFAEVDENIVNIASVMLGELISKFSVVDWTEAFYDPITQHMVAPFAPRGTNSARLEDPQGTVFITSSPDSPRKSLVETLDSFAPAQLIRRLTLPLTHSATTVPVGLNAAPSLREVDTYVSNLHDCWRRSVELNVQQTAQERAKMTEMKQLRDDLHNHKVRCAKVEEELRLHTLDSTDYQREYAELKQELENYLRAKGRLET